MASLLTVNRLIGFVFPTTRPVWVQRSLSFAWWVHVRVIYLHVGLTTKHFHAVVFLKNVDSKDSASGDLDLMSVKGIIEQLQMTHACSCGLIIWLGFIREQWIINSRDLASKFWFFLL